jgi:hypothetical protein
MVVSTCLVTARDYRQHFEGKGAIEAPAWSGVERRLGPFDRRRAVHDRRWNAVDSRRRRMADRRKT